MARLKFSKNELRRQKDHLKRYLRYLPTLHLKKQQLRMELNRIRHDRNEVQGRLDSELADIERWVAVFGEEVELDRLFGVRRVDVSWENVAGVDVPTFEAVRLRREDYDLFDTPLWVDRAMDALEKVASLRAELSVLEDQERRIFREWRLTAQRVNLFEQVKIPEARANIRRISIYLGDQQTAAFGWALIAKRKLENQERNSAANESEPA